MVNIENKKMVVDDESRALGNVQKRDKLVVWFNDFLCILIIDYFSLLVCRPSGKQILYFYFLAEGWRWYWSTNSSIDKFSSSWTQQFRLFQFYAWSEIVLDHFADTTVVSS